jgi:RNA polymerase sigma-70 factor (ECF subfamily)
MISWHSIFSIVIVKDLFQMYSPIWSKIKAGDKQAFKLFFDEYYSSFCLYANSILDDLELSQDIVSDCFVKIWERKDKIQIKTSIEKYVLLSVRNSIYSYLRSPRSKNIDIEFIIERLENTSIEEYDIEKEETIQRIYKLIEELPEQRKRILELATFKGMSYKDIAEKLNISVNTVKTQLSRAYHFLREKLMDDSIILWLIFEKK